jgi:hypothetical protein
MSDVLNEYKTSRMNAMSSQTIGLAKQYTDSFFLSGWEQGFDEAIEYSKHEAIRFAHFSSAYHCILGDKQWLMKDPPFTKYTDEEFYNLYMQTK